MGTRGGPAGRYLPLIAPIYALAWPPEPTPVSRIYAYAVSCPPPLHSPKHPLYICDLMLFPVTSRTPYTHRIGPPGDLISRAHHTFSHAYITPIRYILYYIHAFISDVSWRILPQNIHACIYRFLLWCASGRWENFDDNAAVCNLSNFYNMFFEY